MDMEISRKTWKSRSAFLLVGVLILAGPGTLLAGERQPLKREYEGRRSPAVSLVGQVWGWLTSVWAKEGALINPDGLRVSSGTGGQRDLTVVPAVQGSAGSAFEN
jgi:hypothetical protein